MSRKILKHPKVAAISVEAMLLLCEAKELVLGEILFQNVYSPNARLKAKSQAATSIFQQLSC